MNGLQRLGRRLRILLQKDRVESELSDEVRHHVDLEAEDLVRQGWDEPAARREAQLRFGGVEPVKEAVRSVRPMRWLEDLKRDAGYAFRSLYRRPVFTLALVLSLSIGIGANTSIFSLLNAVMWRMLPVERPEDLWKIGEEYTYPDFRALAEEDDDVLAGAAAYSPATFEVNIDGNPEPPVDGLLVSGEYFTLLGVAPAAGRMIDVGDDGVPDGHPVAVISDGFWNRRFGRDPAVIGRTISVSGTPLTIIGVTPPEFFGIEVGKSPDLYVPLMMQPSLMRASSPDLLTGRAAGYSTWLRVFGRLHPSVGPEAAFSALDTRFRLSFLDQFGGQLPRTPEGPVTASAARQNAEIVAMVNMLYDSMRPKLESAARGVSELRGQFSRPLYILMTVVGILLLVTCANTANLLLARAAARRREFATRMALGAGRWRIVRQLLVESVLLAGLGGLAGVLLARWTIRLLVVFMSRGRAPIVLDLGMDLRVLAFAAAVSALTGILFGLTPALRATASKAPTALSGTAGWIASGRGLATDRLLAIFQIALSLVLLVGAALFLRSLAALNERDSGFPRDRVLIARLFLENWNDTGRAERLARTYDELIRRIEDLPGVTSASFAEFTPTNRSGRTVAATTTEGNTVSVQKYVVSPGYFRTMGIELLAGRDFESADRMSIDELLSSPRIISIVNETYARRVWPGESPIGRPCLTSSTAVPCTIVGLVRDSAYADFSGEVQAIEYQPLQPAGSGSVVMALHVRTATEPAPIVPGIRSVVTEVDPLALLYQVRTLAEEIDAVLVQQRLVATLTGVFGVAALLLAAVGLYGLLAFAVIRRRPEIGLRIALGAKQRDVVWMVMREALVLVALGGVLGITAGLGLARLAGSRISGLLWGLDAVDPVSFAFSWLVLAATAAVAAYLPAYRASLVDPNDVLRNE